MPEAATIPPPRRPELLLRPLGEKGQHVVKDPRTGEYYNLGEQEAFLLARLDGLQTSAAICTAFEERFGEPLSGDDLNEFLELARVQGFLQPADQLVLAVERAAVAVPTTAPAGPVPAGPASGDQTSSGSGQSILYWRRTLFDPDRLFSWLAPKLAFLWTRTFFSLSLGCILAAALLLWTNRHTLASYLPRTVRWETLALAWVTLLVVTTCHEFAHGLTCKHHGGEVHEVGFLLMFFMPCFYCNVSDAWLIRAKSKRLWVTLAGGYCDLCLWALAVFVWRLTLPNSLAHYLAWVVLTVCGLRVFFNFNPLLKLDGYYLLSDWLEVPNLRQRALSYVAGHLRWLLWGATRPAPEARGRFLLAYGLASWLFSMAYLVLMLLALYQFLGARWGLVGIGGVALLAVVTLRGMFQGLGGGEVLQMILVRRKRTVLWLLLLGAVAAALTLVEVEDRASGSFRVRPASRAKLRAPVSGFLHTVYFDQGERVSPGVLVACLEVPDLASRLARKRAEVLEAQAKLRLLEAGPRPEEVREQRQRVTRALAWRDLARRDLTRKRQACQDELVTLNHLVGQRQAELNYAEEALRRARNLLKKKSLPREQQREAEKQVLVCRTLLEQARAQKRARAALGTLEAEGELARREKQLADARSALVLLEAGSRPEEVEAERARLARLKEEVRYLESLQEKVRLTSAVSGLVSTPRLREKVGQYFREGELICVIEEPAGLEAEIAVEEQEAARIRPGQRVELKARALPFQIFAGHVDRIAPSATRGEVQSSVTLYCRLRDSTPDLLPEMTGQARISCGRRSLGEILGRRVLRFLRTEFWW